MPKPAATFDLGPVAANDGPILEEQLVQAAAAVHAAIRKKNDTVVRALGEELDRRGGLGLMQEVHRRFTGRLRGSARLVEMLWTGIGAWRG